MEALDLNDNNPQQQASLTPIGGLQPSTDAIQEQGTNLLTTEEYREQVNEVPQAIGGAEGEDTGQQAHAQEESVQNEPCGKNTEIVYTS